MRLTQVSPMTTSTTELNGFLAEARDATNAVLDEWCDRARRDLPGDVGEAVAYSLSAPGKRLRPALVLGVYRELGGDGDVVEIAAAVDAVSVADLLEHLAQFPPDDFTILTLGNKQLEI